MGKIRGKVEVFSNFSISPLISLSPLFFFLLFHFSSISPFPFIALQLGK